MGFNLFGNRNIKQTRERYVKEFAVQQEDLNEEFEPCEKYVACLERLSKEFVLFLKDENKREEVGTMQVADRNDVEFSEGYDLAPNYTDSVRKNAIKHAKHGYFMLISLVDVFSRLENSAPQNDRVVLNALKTTLRTMSNVSLNILQVLTMKDSIPQLKYSYGNIPQGYCDGLLFVKNMLLEAVEHFIRLQAVVVIEYINRQVELILQRLTNIVGQVDVLIEYCQ